MRIVTHGTSIWFQCMECGCEFICNPVECVTEEITFAVEKKITNFYHECPECGNEQIEGRPLIEVRKQKEGK